MDEKEVNLWFEELVNEKSNIALASVLGSKVDFSRLRDITARLYEYDPDTYAINVSGSDAELWHSVRDFLKQYEP